MTSRKAKKGRTPYLISPLRGGRNRGGNFALSTCQLFNLSTKIDVAADPWSAKKD